MLLFSYMQCPIDQTTLSITERRGIEIDYCPKCRGVWLDRGELDKLIDASVSASPSATSSTTQDYYPEPRHDRRHEYDDSYKKKRKKESFLGELFDF
jgi:uncharacterized protein